MSYLLIFVLLIFSFLIGVIFSKKSKSIKKKLNIFSKRHKSLKKVVVGTQPVYFRKSTKHNQPLIVRLHNWSSDYRHRDYLSKLAAAEDWNYIHPNFQGSNNQPNACGSEAVIKEIDDAIDYAIKQGNVDLSNIFVVGASGGGHATLITLLNSKHKVNTFMAWVPITDVESWYYESVGRKQKYANDILKITGSGQSLNVEEARKRSPLYQDVSIDKLKETKIKLFAGIHDGYTGPVPMTHTINFYNKLATVANEELIPQDEILYLLEKRRAKQISGEIDGKEIHLYRKFGNVEVTIFEGGHDMLDQHTMNVLKLLVNAKEVQTSPELVLN